MSLLFHVLIHELLAKSVTSVNSQWCETALCECPCLPQDKLQPGGMGIFVFRCKSVCVSTCWCTSLCVCAHICILYTGYCCIAFPSCLRGTLLCACSPQVSFLLIASSFSVIYYKSTLHTFLFLIRILILDSDFFSFCTTDLNKRRLIFKET